MPNTSCDSKVLMDKARIPPIPPRRYPSREDQLNSLQKESFDILIIGGGATGCGVALDAVTRGFKTALVECDDFSAGTSSRSTKLIHGGVRYLQKAIMHLDIDQYRMVKEALSERANLLKIAPHLSNSLPIMLPVYKWWQLPYFYAGIKMYDWVAGRECLQPSYIIGKRRALSLFPMLKKDELKGAIVYYDGQHNDARMNLAIALTAVRYGATVANHVTVTEIIKAPEVHFDSGIHVATGNQVISGVKLKDNLTGKEWEVKAKCVVNATGPFTDSIRQMDQPDIKPICSPSSGVHIVLPDYYSPEKMGLLDPATSDGRVIFFLPWEHMTIAGTTDVKCKVTHSPIPTESEIEFILKEVRNYLTPELQVRRGDVTSAWSGIRPLVSDPNDLKNTENIARNHIIHVSPAKLITIAGGKWTTYRRMAEETVDIALKTFPEFKNFAGPCITSGLLLDGAHKYTPTLFIQLVQDFGIQTEVARHLADTYGDAAFSVLRLAQVTGLKWPVLGKRLHQEFPYIEAEVKYACKEYACTLVDVIARRSRFAFLNASACEHALPFIAELMAGELGWNKKKVELEIESARIFLFEQMGLKAYSEVLAKKIPVDFDPAQMTELTQKFADLSQGKQYITVKDLGTFLKKHGQTVSYDQLHEMLSEVDLNKNGQIELSEFLQLMYGLKTGTVSSNRFALAAQISAHNISVDRSGGGV
ncbi:unnamed protein product [Gordionus sp. m RMFG-2023]